MLRGFYPAEKIVGCFAVFAISAYLLFEVPLRHPGELYWNRICSGFVLYGVGLGISLLILRLHDLDHGVLRRQESWQKFKALYLTPQSLISDLRLIHIVALMFVVFIHLKHLVPIANGRVFDKLLYDSETWLFRGMTAGEALQAWLGRTIAPVLSDCYTAFYPYLAMVIFIMILQRSPLLRQEFIATFVTVWLIGVLIVFVFPTWGPCFFSPNTVASLPATEVSEMQLSLWQQKLFLDKQPLAAEGVNLISGFPSLHLAIVILGSVYLHRVFLPLAMLSWAFCALTLISTLYFNWHYLLDDLGSVFLVATIMKLRSMICDDTPS